MGGAFKVTSQDGFRYFLTIVDDFSRAVWLYLLNSKDQTLNSVVSFFSLIKTQFGKKVKICISDNGTEFVNQNVHNCFEQNGLVHQTSVYSP